jgi:hypothetical protein
MSFFTYPIHRCDSSCIPPLYTFFLTYPIVRQVFLYTYFFTVHPLSISLFTVHSL